MLEKILWDRCNALFNNIKDLLPRFFDPLEDFTMPEYIEFARSLLELYRCIQLMRLDNRELGRIDDTLVMLNGLIELSFKNVIKKYSRVEYSRKLKESLNTLSESEAKILNEYLKLGLQLVGFNLTPLVPFISDKLYIQYLGLVLKISAIIAVYVKKYWAKRIIRKLSVNIESLARRLADRLGRYRDEYRRELGVGGIEDIVKEGIDLHNLAKHTEELYREQIYVNTPEVIAFAKELQELREEYIIKLKKQ